MLALTVVPVAGVEPARVISPTDFESASSANSNTPASIILSHLPMPHPRKRRDIKYHAEGYTPKIALADAIFELKFRCV